MDERYRDRSYEDIEDEDLQVADEDILEPAEASFPLPAPTRSYDEAKKIWASKRTGIDIDKITRVEIDIEAEEEYNTYGDAGAFPVAYVRVFRKTGGRPEEVYVSSYDFEDILREIFKAGL